MKTPVITALVVTLCGTMAVSAGATPQSKAAKVADLDHAVATLLSGYEHVPTTADWQRIGPPEAVAQRLTALASSGDHAFERSRALSSLGHFRLPAVASFLKAQAYDVALDVRWRGKALIAWAFQGKEAVAPQVASFLTHKNPRLREDAVRGLRNLAAKSVAAVLTARAQTEPVPHIRDALRQAAARVDSNRAALQRANRPVPQVTMPSVLPRAPTTP